MHKLIITCDTCNFFLSLKFRMKNKNFSASRHHSLMLDYQSLYFRKKKGEFDLQAYFKRQINKFKREVAMDIHKVWLMMVIDTCRCED